jgi:membrane-associated phospholipid phosphatase
MQGWRRGALAWGLATITTFATMLALKVVFIACWRSFGTLHLHTPSGHVAAAAFVGGGLVGMLLQQRLLAVICAVGAALLIGLTRLWLGAHSVSEVVLGAGVGLGGTMLLIWLAGRPRVVSIKSLLAVALMTVVLFHGLHLPAEGHIRGIAFRMARMLAVCSIG